jgi:hypothetical protein
MPARDPYRPDAREAADGLLRRWVAVTVTHPDDPELLAFVQRSCSLDSLHVFGVYLHQPTGHVVVRSCEHYPIEGIGFGPGSLTEPRAEGHITFVPGAFLYAGDPGRRTAL